MYKIVKRLHLIECDCCGEPQIVDDETLVDMIYDGMIDIEEDECDGNCEDCNLH